MKPALLLTLLLCAGAPASAHRLDEYLQATIVSVEKDRLQAQMTLTPGVAIFPVLLALIDTDGDGAISASEQRAYAGQVLRDLALAIDEQPLTPRLDSLRFPGMEEMKEGRGEIRLEFSAALPGGGRNRSVTLENYHERRMSAYLVNCLVPRDPDIRVIAQARNYTQSEYRLEYVQTDVWVMPLLSELWSGRVGIPAMLALILAARLALWCCRARGAKVVGLFQMARLRRG